MRMARKHARQVEIPGTESPGRIPELHALGIELDEIKTEKAALKERETEKLANVRHYLEENGLASSGYDCDGVHLWLEKGEAKVKVKVKPAPEVIP